MITKHKVKRKIISVCIAASILFGIMVLSPAHSGAVSVSISNLQEGYAQGSKIKFYAEVKINTDELIPIENITITLKNGGNEIDRILFDVNGSIILHSGPTYCIESVTCVAMTATYECGDLYGYDQNEGQGYDFGYGWGYGCKYGYGYDWDSPGYLKYECTINTTELEYGDYALRVDLNTGSSVHPAFSSAEYSFNIGALGSHNPIQIYGNSDFTFANGVSSGSGTSTDPYIIENWDINISKAGENYSWEPGIEIRDTDVYFIIRNCVIHEWKYYYWGWGHGIYFYEVTNGKIENCTIYNNYKGIYLEHSSNNQITNCSVYNNSDDGIWLYSSSNNNITNCAVYNNNYYGIMLYYSSNNNTISNCAVYNNYRGIWLGSSSNNQITNCAVYNNNNDGIYLFYSSNNTITNCNVYNNSYYGIWLGSSSNNQISNCNVYNNDLGIYLYSSSNNNQIINCAVYNNDWHGICLSSSSNNNNITNCAVYNNYYGILLDYSSNNKLRNNVLNNNSYNFGVYGWDISHYEQDIDTSNTISGKPIYYVVKQSNLVFDETMSIGYLGLVSCSNIIVKNIILTNNSHGLLLVNTSYSTIIDCAVYNNSNGIYLCWYSSNNQISNCAVYNNWDGIELCYSSNNTQITNCTVYNNNHYGIRIIYSSNNTQITNCAVYNNSIGIWLYDSSNNQIINCTVYNNDDGIWLEYSSNNNIITNCAVYNNSYGIFLGSSSDNNNVSNCTITGNEYAIRIAAKGNIIRYCNINSNWNGILIGEGALSGNEIHYSDIYNNKEYGVATHETTATVDATYNWWGAADGPSALGPGSGDNVGINVIYEPWVTEPWSANVLLDFRLSLSSSTSSLYSNENCVITVYVTEKTSGLPVENAYVFLDTDAGFPSPINGYTDSNGYFYSTFTAPNVTKHTSVRISANVSKSKYVSTDDYIDIITFAWGIEPILADAGADKTVSDDEVVQFDGSGSVGKNLTLTYCWDFDITDGVTVDSTDVCPIHIYSLPGKYVAMLTVKNGTMTANDTVVVTVTRTANLVYNTNNIGYNYISWFSRESTNASSLSALMGSIAMPKGSFLSMYNTTIGMWQFYIVGVNNPGDVDDFTINPYDVVCIRVAVGCSIEIEP